MYLFLVYIYIYAHEHPKKNVVPSKSRRPKLITEAVGSASACKGYLTWNPTSVHVPYVRPDNVSSETCTNVACRETFVTLLSLAAVRRDPALG